MADYENQSQLMGDSLVYDLIPLGTLLPGQRGFVEQVVGRPEQVRRLEELGLRSGVRVEMVQSGSPCIVHLAGHKLCFRAADVLRVMVRLGACV